MRSSVSARGAIVVTEEQLSNQAVFRLAADPPPEVGEMQRRTTKSLLRAFPLGLRFSGKNMNPIPGYAVACSTVRRCVQRSSHSNLMAAHMTYACAMLQLAGGRAEPVRQHECAPPTPPTEFEFKMCARQETLPHPALQSVRTENSVRGGCVVDDRTRTWRSSSTLPYSTALPATF